MKPQNLQSTDHKTANPSSAAQPELDIHHSGPVLITTEVGDKDWHKAYSPSNNCTHVIKASLFTDGQFRAEVSMQYIISHPRARQTNTEKKPWTLSHIIQLIQIPSN